MIMCCVPASELKNSPDITRGNSILEQMTANLPLSLVRKAFVIKPFLKVSQIT